MSLLAIEHLDIAVDGCPLLHDVNLTLAAGEILGLVGESGSGKSLTALAVLGLLPAGATRQGRILLGGDDLTARREVELNRIRGRDVGIVFQEPMTALNPLMSIGEQVAETVRLHRRVSAAEAWRVARDTLERVGLPGDRASLARYPHALSGGQRQRVAIAIAVALAPRLIIADEPTTALDVTTQAQILDLLRRLVREDGCGLILVSHDLAVVGETTDRVAVMQAGRIVESGPTGQVLGQPRHPYTQALLANAAYAPTRAPAVEEGSVPVLEVRQVVRDYARPRRSLRFWRRPDAFRAADRVSLEVRRGESVGLVGESGCGKSTLLRTVLALEAPQGGEVRLHGETFSTARGAALRALRRRIQVVFQDPYGSFNPGWTVERLVAEPLHLLDAPLPADERRRRVEAALAQVGLQPADADRLPHQFSGGQRQRIAIARALAVEPDVIVLDEAVSALDVTARAQILDLLADIGRRLRVAILFVSHDLGVIRASTDRVYVMQQGRIVESGATAQVFATPRHPYTQALLAATPDLTRALASLAPASDRQVA